MSSTEDELKEERKANRSLYIFCTEDELKEERGE